MKKLNRYIAIMLIAIVVTTGCSKGGKLHSNEFIKETDYPYMFASGMDGMYIASNDDGYYYLDGAFLFYMDKITMNPVILCNKPNCKHINEESIEQVWKCNAYIGGTVTFAFLQIYQDELYAVTTIDDVNKKYVNRLIKISLDGTTRKEIADISNMGMSIIHRGYIYSCSQGMSGEPSQITKRSLDDSTDETVIYTSSMTESSISINAFGNYITIRDFGVHNINKESLVSRLYTYNINDGELTKIGNMEDDEGYAVQLNGFTNSEMIYILSDLSLGIDETDDHTKNYACGFNGENNRILVTLPNEKEKYGIGLTTDDKYFYGEMRNNLLDKEEITDREFLVYDNDFNIIAKTPLKDFDQFFTTCVGDENYMFFRFRLPVPVGEGFESYTYSMNKNDFADGKAEFKLVQKASLDLLNPTIMLK